MATAQEIAARIADAMGNRTIANLAHELSELSGREIRWHEVQRYLKGQHKPSTERIQQIGKALGVRVEWLLTGIGPRTVESSPVPRALPSAPAEVERVTHYVRLDEFYRSGVGSPINESEHRWLASHDHVELPIDGWLLLLMAYRMRRRSIPDAG